MKRLTEADQPLYGRQTGLIQVDPFGYLHVGEFASGYSAKDKIVEAIALGETRWNKISNRVGKSTSSLARPLEWLQEMEVVERIAPITEYPNPSPKSMMYRLRDPYLQFWHTFISDIRTAVHHPGALGSHASGHPIRARHPSGTGTRPAPTESALRRSARRRRTGLPMPRSSRAAAPDRRFVANSRHPGLPFRAARVGSWWAADASDEVDVVAVDGSGGVLFGECKWGSVAREDLQKLERRANLILPNLEGVRTVTLALFSAGRIADTVVQQRIDAGEVLCFSADDLFVA
jgi:hypothetical protein